MNGYAHPRYAESLAEFGNPRELPQCQGWVLERQIPGFSSYDAMGCYPIFVCQDWSQIYADLEDMGDQWVTVALVADPFGEYDETWLYTCFKDIVIPFKDHFIVDLNRSMEEIVSSHHRYYARKALRQVYVEVCQNPAQFVDEWVNLYETLVQRHKLKGVKAFSKTAFVKQLNIPGVVMFRAVSQGVTVGGHIWYVQGQVSYSHLAAYSPTGYRLMASYALYWSAIEYFKNKVSWLDLGSGAGMSNNDADGLTRFKRGWSTGTRTAYFCGRIFAPATYAEIVRTRGIETINYFPAYRAGEFG